MNKDKFYITTAIDYVNAKPHIGHVFEKILADVIARYHREKDDDVFFLTGSDEHGLKIQQVAQEKGVAPQELADGNVKEFVSMKEKFNLSYDRFIRTTEESHIEVAKKLWEKCKAQGDIYLKKYKGFYCTGCESFVKESDLVDGKCPNHDKAPDVVEEENWFFKLSNYKEKIKKLIESGDLRIFPEHRKTEILNALKEIDDFSISRPKEKLSWGIEVPDDPKQNMYVWFDALTNYISGVGCFTDEEKFKKYWPADLHVIGKDITKFHAIYWPAMLLSADIEPPKAILVHGFITSGGKKMSKTLGNTIDIDEAVNRYGIDALRYFLIREIPTTEDGDFTWERFDARYEADLANDLGNLVSRVTNLAEKNDVLSSQINLKEEIYISNDVTDPEYLDTIYDYSGSRKVEDYELGNILDHIFSVVSRFNEVIAWDKPWEIKEKEKAQKLLIKYMRILYEVGKKLRPFMPETSEKILKIFEGERIVKAESLFPKKN